MPTALRLEARALQMGIIYCLSSSIIHDCIMKSLSIYLFYILQTTHQPRGIVFFFIIIIIPQETKEKAKYFLKKD